ncbi:MAG: cytochrome c-type biogenesis protein CcmH [Anaerolineae bacterium]
MLARTPLLVLLILFLSATAVLAQGGIEETVKEIAESLNCPLCQGLTLYDCPLTICEQMRGVIREKLVAGESRETIVQYFVEQYGEEVLNAPPKSGFNLAAWILPFVGLLFGGAFLAIVVASWLRPRSSHPAREMPAPPEGRDPYLDRVERELEEL